MEQPYQKKYPQLMAGKTILYVHGFGSAGSTHTAQLLRELMPQATVIAPDLPLHPSEAMELLHSVCTEQQPQLIVGSSMGGMYAEMLYGYDRIVVNPAFEMGDTMAKHGMVGKQSFQNPRQDGVQEFIITKALVKEYKEITEQCFTGITPGEQQHVYGLFGDADPVVHCYDLFKEHYPQALYFHGEHRLNEKVVMHALLPVVRWIDDRQEGRERKIIYIDRSALIDSRNMPKASLMKAIEFLLEFYDIYFVAPAPTGNCEEIDHMQQWAEQHLSTIAWNRVIYTQHKQLLYGEYLIAGNACPNFMGTCLELGSANFKTWEEVITFFSRLGGQ